MAPLGNNLNKYSCHLTQEYITLYHLSITRMADIEDLRGCAAYSLVGNWGVDGIEMKVGKRMGMMDML